MTGGEWLVFALGTLAMTFLGGYSLVVGRNGTNRFGRYGRETLLCLAGWVLTLPSVRVADVLGAPLSVEDRAFIASITAAVFGAIMLQIAWLHRLDKKLNGKTR